MLILCPHVYLIKHHATYLQPVSIAPQVTTLHIQGELNSNAASLLALPQFLKHEGRLQQNLAGEAPSVEKRVKTT